MKILYFAPIYFDDMKQRPQQIAECLAKKYHVFYVEPTVSLMRQLLKGGRSFQGGALLLKGNQADSKENDCHTGRLVRMRLNGIFTLHKSLEILDPLGMNSLSEYMQIKKLANSCDVIWVGYSGWYTLVRCIKNKPVIFDWMDEEELLVSSVLLKLTLKRNKKRLLCSSDAVLVTCRRFYDELIRRKNVYHVPNAVSQNFLPAENGTMPEKKRAGKKIIFGYIGTISEWFDFDVIRYILGLSREYYVVMAGRNLQPVFVHERVKYIGVRPHEELPQIVRKFDVCLYNFKKNRLLETVNPVKIYEYLAAGRPVLAVSSIETEMFGKYVMRYREKEEIKELLAGGIRSPFESEQEYKEFIGSNTWEERAAVIEGVLSRLNRS